MNFNAEIFFIVIPAKAGIQENFWIPCQARNDESTSHTSLKFQPVLLQYSND